VNEKHGDAWVVDFYFFARLHAGNALVNRLSWAKNTTENAFYVVEEGFDCQSRFGGHEADLGVVSMKEIVFGVYEGEGYMTRKDGVSEWESGRESESFCDRLLCMGV
jgi:hypothetical protein